MIALLSAPSNLGLRPPEPGGVPGTAKAPEALREAGLYGSFQSAGALDAGVVLPGRYVDDDHTRPSGRVRNEEAIVDHARRLGARISALIERGHAPLVLGGDCSLLLSAGLALAVRPAPGLIHIDGHTDFRHPGNSDECASLAGEDLAAAIGLHWPAIADIDGLGPYFAPARTAHIGCRDDDEELAEASARLGLVIPAGVAMGRGMPETAAAAITVAGGSGYWLQLDVDVLDPRWMPAVDSPDPGGLDPDELVGLLRACAPGAVGASITVFDPDLDPDGRYALLLARILRDGLGELGSRVHGG
ncbi:arginase family protein [Mycetocola zhujimingii]|uniref:arginase family protein n=1 Tax=Mycetocola zhujimingii TaxID=2079792 RepID=UPI001E2B39D2|nr:arginase family protein [Mycetocola zhujimingii]